MSLLPFYQSKSHAKMIDIVEFLAIKCTELPVIHRYWSLTEGINYFWFIRRRSMKCQVWRATLTKNFEWSIDVECLENAFQPFQRHRGLLKSQAKVSRKVSSMHTLAAQPLQIVYDGKHPSQARWIVLMQFDANFSNLSTTHELNRFPPRNIYSRWTSPRRGSNIRRYYSYWNSYSRQISLHRGSNTRQCYHRRNSYTRRPFSYRDSYQPASYNSCPGAWRQSLHEETAAILFQQDCFSSNHLRPSRISRQCGCDTHWKRTGGCHHFHVIKGWHRQCSELYVPVFPYNPHHCFRHLDLCSWPRYKAYEPLVLIGEWVPR